MRRLSRTTEDGAGVADAADRKKDHDEPVEGASAPLELPVEVVDAPPRDEAQAGAVVHRGDRYPPNLFLVAAPGIVVFPDMTVPIVLRAPWADRTVSQAASQSEFLGIGVLREADAGAEPPTTAQLQPF